MSDDNPRPEDFISPEAAERLSKQPNPEMQALAQAFDGKGIAPGSYTTPESDTNPVKAIEVKGQKGNKLKITITLRDGLVRPAPRPNIEGTPTPLNIAGAKQVISGAAQATTEEGITIEDGPSEDVLTLLYEKNSRRILMELELSSLMDSRLFVRLLGGLTDEKVASSKTYQQFLSEVGSDKGSPAP